MNPKAPRSGLFKCLHGEMRRSIQDPKGKHVPGVPLDKEKIKELIIKYEGNVTAVARAMQCARRSITRIVNTNPEMQEILEEARERLIDDVIDVFVKKVKKGDDTAAMIFWLKMQARSRGFDAEFQVDMKEVTRQALDFALNKSRNPAERTIVIDPNHEAV